MKIKSLLNHPFPEEKNIVSTLFIYVQGNVIFVIATGRITITLMLLGRRNRINGLRGKSLNWLGREAVPGQTSRRQEQPPCFWE